MRLGLFFVPESTVVGSHLVTVVYPLVAQMPVLPVDSHGFGSLSSILFLQGFGLTLLQPANNLAIIGSVKYKLYISPITYKGYVGSFTVKK